LTDAKVRTLSGDPLKFEVEPLATVPPAAPVVLVDPDELEWLEPPHAANNHTMSTMTAKTPTVFRRIRNPPIRTLRISIWRTLQVLINIVKAHGRRSTGAADAGETAEAAAEVSLAHQRERSLRPSYFGGRNWSAMGREVDPL
jgi:hypothetical protein